MEIYYERDGIVIIADEDKTTFKKNGLTIQIPNYILHDYADEFEREEAILMKELRDKKYEN